MYRFLSFIFLVLCLFLSSCSKDEQSGVGISNATSDSFTGPIDNKEDPNSGETYVEYPENPFINASDEPLSTFSIDADGGSYSNVRRFLEDGKKPEDGAVRIEEMINYFKYDYPSADGEHPLAVNTEIATCPWNTEHKLIQIGIKGDEVPRQDYPFFNFVFLIDVSGSMSAENKLPLLKEGFELLVDQMRPQDRIALVTYAGNSGIQLESTDGNNKSKINKAIRQLNTGGGTNGESGIHLAYEVVQENFIEGGNNRVILATDGDFNIGVSSFDGLIELIEDKRDQANAFLSVVGCGGGNYNDAALEQIANNGNGTYEYMDDLDQARKIFVTDFGKLYTVAKDVKIQIEFDPVLVEQYRLIGYENRVLQNEDFEDDEKDAGELGMGQNVTAMYEVILKKRASYLGTVPLKVDFRYKPTDEDISKLIQVEARDESQEWDTASENFQFAASVAACGLLLRDSEYAGDATYDKIYDWANASRSFDPNGLKIEFLELVEMAKKVD